MKISTKGRYGLKAMVDIATYGAGKCVSIKSTAERIGVSESYLEQLIMMLKKSGYVKSVRGAQGGYSLKKPAGEISVGDILEIMEGSLYPVKCLDENADFSCGSGSCEDCATKPVWEKIYNSVSDVVFSITIEDLAKQATEIKGDVISGD